MIVESEINQTSLSALMISAQQIIKCSTKIDGRCISAINENDGIFNYGMNSPQAQIYDSELKFISECVIHFPNIETGGDFFGFWSREGNPIIQYVIGPGEKITQTPASFFQDIDYLRECGNILHDRFGLEHIGAWHSHHQLGIFKPSGGDVRTMHNALRNEHTSRFLISICNIERESAVSIGSYLFSQDNDSDYVSCPVLVLPGSSPIRDTLRQSSNFRWIKETRQKDSNGFASYNLRNVGEIKAQYAQDEPEKPSFTENSYWATKEGQKYLKKVYDKLKGRNDLSDVEIKQLEDNKLVISFVYEGAMCEIRFPDNFPESVPDVVVLGKHKENKRSFFRRKVYTSKYLSAEAIQEMVNSLNMLGENRRIIIRYQQPQ